MSQRKIDDLAQTAASTKERKNRPSKLRLEREAKRAVAVFNVRALSRFPTQVAWPTFRAALTAKRYYLTVWCPACKNVACVDIRPERLRYHPDASINCLIPYLSCSRCCPNPPFAQILGLRRYRMKGARSVLL
jgi:hypothetical protein